MQSQRMTRECPCLACQEITGATAAQGKSVSAQSALQILLRLSVPRSGLITHRTPWPRWHHFPPWGPDQSTTRSLLSSAGLLAADCIRGKNSTPAGHVCCPSTYSPGKNRDALVVDDCMDLVFCSQKSPLEIDCGVIMSALGLPPPMLYHSYLESFDSRRRPRPKLHDFKFSHIE